VDHSYNYSDEFKALKKQYEDATMGLALIASAAAKADPKGHFLVVSAAKEFNDASTRYFNYGKESK
jgi:hypothetical protein